MPDRSVWKKISLPALLALGLIPALVLALSLRTSRPEVLPVHLSLQQDTTQYEALREYGDLPSALPDPLRFLNPHPADRPWIVWYWPGTEVELMDLYRQLAWIRDQGFGGIEIVITGKGIDPVRREGSFRDPVWVFTLRELSRMADHYDLGLDWTLGPGIPADYCTGQEILTWGEAHIRGGRVVSAKIPSPNPSSGHQFASALNREGVQHDRWIQHSTEGHTLLGIWAARAREDNRSVTWWKTTDQILLDPDSTFSLLPFVRGDSILNWQAPPGYWKCIALYQSPQGATPFHEVAAYQEVLASPYDGRDWVQGIGLDPLFQSFPRDSLGGRAIRWQFQPAVADRFVSDLHPLVKAKKAGEDCPEWLMIPQPFVDHASANALEVETRPEYVLSDLDAFFRNQYEQQLTDSCLNPSLGAAGRRMRQSGSLLKLRIDDWHAGWFTMGALADIPGFSSSIAGGNRMGARLVSSAAEWSGHDRIAGYVGATAAEAFKGTPATLKQEIDRMFLAGANEIVVDGLAYPRREGGGHWHPGATAEIRGFNKGSQIGPRDPLNAWWPDLWTFTARTQYLQRLGQRETDFLILYPYTRFPQVALDSAWSLLPRPGDPDHRWEQLSTLTRSLLNHQQDSLSAWLEQLIPMIRELERWGYSWSWIDELGVQNLTWEDEYVRIGASKAKGLIIPEGGIMKRSTAADLLGLHQQGARIFFPGTRFPVANELNGVDSLSSLIRQELSAFRLSYPVSGPGELIRWIRASDISPAVPLLVPAGSVRMSSRALSDGSQMVWLVNHTNAEEEIQLAAQDKRCFLLDPETGLATPLQADERGRWTLSITRLGSRILWMGKQITWPDSLTSTRPHRPEPSEFRFTGADFRQLSVWEWAIPSGGSSRNVDILRDTSLWDWASDASLKDYQGVIGYSCDVMIGRDQSQRRFVLDLGEVRDACEVIVNTKSLPRQSWPPYRFSLDSILRPGLNTIQVWVTNTRRNEQVGLAANGDPATAYLMGHDNERSPAGLLGPVKLWALPPDDDGDSARPEM